MSRLIRSIVYLIILAACLSFLSGCGTLIPGPTPTPTFTETPIPPTPTPVPPTNTPEPTQTPEPTLPPTKPPPPPATPKPVVPTETPYGQKPIYIYFIALNTGGNIAAGCGGKEGDSLVAIDTGLRTTDDVILNVEHALRQLFIYHTELIGELYNPLYKSQISVASVQFDTSGSRIIVELSGKDVKTDDKCDGSRVMAMLMATIRQFTGGAGNPDISLNGSGIKNFLSGK